MLFPLIVAITLFALWTGRVMGDLKFIECMLVLLMYRFDLFIWAKVQAQGEQAKKN